MEKADVPAQEVENIDIGTTLVALAGFIARFNNSQSCRVRLKLCALCDCVCERKDTLTLRRDTSARHDIIDILMEWMLDPSSVRPLSLPGAVRCSGCSNAFDRIGCR